MKTLTFPQNFIWGTSTNAIQVEGNLHPPARGKNIWDRHFIQTGGSSLTTPQQGADHISYYKEDIARLSEMGIRHYCFSLSWSRIFPEGTGKASAEGISFYQELIDELCRKKISPWLVLYGNDMPEPLQKNGGWLKRETGEYFSDFSRHMAALFSDRVSNWITLYDPFTELNYGYRLGTYAPGSIDQNNIFIAAHNMLMGHAAAAAVLKSEGSNRTGLSLSLNPPRTIGYMPAGIRKKAKDFMTYLFLDPLYSGRYPSALENSVFRQNRSNIQPRDLDKISSSIDFLLIRHSGYAYIKRNIFLNNLHFEHIKKKRRRDVPGTVATIEPDSLSDLLYDISPKYNNPEIYISISSPIDISQENGLNDHERIYFLRQYLEKIHSLISDGLNIQGFFAHPFIDGFEFDSRSNCRSGIIHVDFSTYERMIKKSGTWYSGVCTSNGFNL